MYNAQCSHESPGSHGTTKLHMDMADALNIMVHSETKPNGQPGCAAWDLFRAEDSQSIRKYLRMKFIDSPGSVSTGKGRTNGNIVAPALLDPIHSQEFYLDSALRKELWEMRGVKSHRVYQTPGQAVFIPAGCAHQVSDV
jgi:[histone H3]-dimethyl-L-lysine9 demethylase